MTNCSGFVTGSAHNSTAFIRLNTAVLIPIPSAKESTAAAVKPGLFRRIRSPYRTSVPRSPIQFTLRASRHFSLVCSIPPKSRRARRCASSCVIPCATYSWVFRSRWSRSSSSSSWSVCAQRNNDRSRSGIVNRQCSGRILQPPFGAKRHSRLFKLNNPRNGARKPAPVICFFFELSVPESCERIVFRPPAILGCFPLGRNPALLFQLVQSRVVRSVAHLQHVARHLL